MTSKWRAASLTSYYAAPIPASNINQFCCGNPEIDVFLHQSADAPRIANIFLLQDHSELLGFFTLQNDSLELSRKFRSSHSLKNLGINTYPAIVINFLLLRNNIKTRTLALK
ncbi:hypothetical protein [Lacticaseibacillus sharpeae]|uniref:hypothetical protein n=1 Tax=Lacticaseibacillus sharpeae TaxID=1626 RepID=UPI0006CF62F0|nr:hypothetical protein [Lacticaseibacillus sharpeae]